MKVFLRSHCGFPMLPLLVIFVKYTQLRPMECGVRQSISP